MTKLTTPDVFQQGLWYAFGDFLEMLSMGAMKGAAGHGILAYDGTVPGGW